MSSLVGIIEVIRKYLIEKGLQMSEVKYPEVEVQLTGNDGNAFAIMGAVSKALRRAGVDKLEIDEYVKESMSGDYDNLLRTAMRWVSVD
jgi:hypothetical protein